MFQLHATHPVAQAIGVFALVCVAGLAIGSVKARGIGLGTAGVLFAGLITGHFSKPVDHAMLDFVKESSGCCCSSSPLAFSWGRASSRHYDAMACG